MGGVARRATVIKNTRKASQHVLVLDAGNSLIGEQASPTEPAAKTQGRSSVEILNRLGYDAVALGEQDVALGREALKSRLAEARGFPFLSANLKDQATGKLFTEPYVIKALGGHRIAVIGITGGVPVTSTEFSLVAPVDAARDAVRRVESQADVIILLSSARTEENKLIGSQVPGVDLIISAGTDALSEPLKLPGGTLMVKADQSTLGHAGRVVAKLQADFDRAGAMTGNKWTAITLDSSVVDDPDMAAWAQGVMGQQ